VRVREVHQSLIQRVKKFYKPVFTEIDNKSNPGLEDDYKYYPYENDKENEGTSGLYWKDIGLSSESQNRLDDDLLSKMTVLHITWYCAYVCSLNIFQ
jgi:hypothetical protein